jgi:hypothetical protein
MENASKEYNHDRIQELIKKQEDEEWTFVFLMAGLTRRDAEAYSASLMGRGYVGGTMNYEKGMEDVAFQSLACSTANWGVANRAAMRAGVKASSAKLAENFYDEGSRDIKKAEGSRDIKKDVKKKS